MKTMDIKRLTIDLSKDEHFKLKVLASYEGLSMKDYLLSHALRESKASKNDETAYLLKSKKNKERLVKALGSKKSSRSFDSIKDLKNALGI